LNDFPEFAGLNPSLEHFARILCTALDERVKASNLSAIQVVLWEHENAWASYRVERLNV
jgi:6-pyruvoyltetrahydropterin/6-carboxytetrahydropterin synthase